jgi:hypothetical protein
MAVSKEEKRDVMRRILAENPTASVHEITANKLWPRSYGKASGPMLASVRGRINGSRIVGHNAPASLPSMAAMGKREPLTAKQVLERLALVVDAAPEIPASRLPALIQALSEK